MSLPGTLFVIAAPSGAGKTSLVDALIQSESHVTVSISHTTRDKRPLEKDGVNYYFIDEKTFQEMIKQHAFLEYATVFHHFYGTSRHYVEETLAKGLDVILEIDWQGAQQIKKLFPESVSIFILPPSLEDLSIRLKTRNQDKPEIIAERLQDAKETVSHIHEFDYVVVNDTFDHAVHDLKTIIDAHRLLQKRQALKLQPLIQELIA